MLHVSESHSSGMRAETHQVCHELMSGICLASNHLQLLRFEGTPSVAATKDVF